MFFFRIIHSYIFNYDLISDDSVKFTKSSLFYGPNILLNMFIHLSLILSLNLMNFVYALRHHFLRMCK